MHPLFPQSSGMTHDVIGAAIEVHKDKGPGLLESIYEWCLTMELQLRGHQVTSQDKGQSQQRWLHSVGSVSSCSSVFVAQRANAEVVSNRILRIAAELRTAFFS